MNKKLSCIMLIDDNSNDNFFHSRVIKHADVSEQTVTKESAEEALDFLKADKTDGKAHPELIFLDINMPRMNGWEFLDEYRKLDEEQQSKIVIVMLTTSENPEDLSTAQKFEEVSDFRTKPLTEEMLIEIINKYF